MYTNWTSPKTNIFSAVNALRNCLASGYDARLIKLENEKCDYPIRTRKTRNKPYKEQITKKFNRKLWVVEMLYNNESKAIQPLFTKILMAIITWLAYPLKFIPKKSVLRMPEYTLYTFRIGAVVHGYEFQFQIPKKFSFKDNTNV